MVEKLFHCEICRSKVLESRLKKHHAKVHANSNFDIYKPLTNVASENLPNTDTNTNAGATVSNQVSMISSVWGIEPPKDVSTIHVPCSICGNKMPAASLDEHMKRKHPEAVDQVDAIGTMTDAISLDTAGKHTPMIGSMVANPFAKKVMPTQSTNNNNNNNNQKSPPTAQMEPKKDVIDFGRNFKSAADFDQSHKPVADSSPSKEETFYTIRINEAQMQEFLNNKRIFPKDGAFYLK